MMIFDQKILIMLSTLKATFNFFKKIGLLRRLKFLRSKNIYLKPIILVGLP